MKITISISKGEAGLLIGRVKEFPEVISQGKNQEELIENIQNDLALFLKDVLAACGVKQNEI